MQGTKYVVQSVRGNAKRLLLVATMHNLVPLMLYRVIQQDVAEQATCVQSIQSLALLFLQAIQASMGVTY